MHSCSNQVNVTEEISNNPYLEQNIQSLTMFNNFKQFLTIWKKIATNAFLYQMNESDIDYYLKFWRVCGNWSLKQTKEDYCLKTVGAVLNQRILFKVLRMAQNQIGEFSLINLGLSIKGNVRLTPMAKASRFIPT